MILTVCENKKSFRGYGSNAVLCSLIHLIRRHLLLSSSKNDLYTLARLIVVRMATCTPTNVTSKRPAWQVGGVLIFSVGFRVTV